MCFVVTTIGGIINSGTVFLWGEWKNMGTQLCAHQSGSNQNPITPILGRVRLVLPYLVALPPLNAKVWSVNVVEVSNHTLAKCGVGSKHD